MNIKDTIAVLEDCAEDIEHSPLAESFADKLSDELGQEVNPDDIVFYVRNNHLCVLSAPEISTMLDEARNSAADGDWDSAQCGYESIMFECGVSYTVKDKLPWGAARSQRRLRPRA